MKYNRLTALTLAALMGAVCITGCGQKKSNTETSAEASSEIILDDPAHIGKNRIEASLLETVSANDTVFTLNSVVSPKDKEEEGCRFIYFDVSIKNNSDTAYTLSTLNNFYILLEDGTEVYSDIRTQLYAASNFKEDSYFTDPFDIPANGEFKGLIGGFLLKKDVEKFTVGFYPTKDSPRAKGDVIVIDITADKIQAPDASILK